MAMNTKQVIVMRKDLNMRKGKMVAQGAHASMAVLLDMMTRSENKVLKTTVRGEPCALIENSGLTEFHGVKTKTCCAIGPWWSYDIDLITGKLELL